MRARHLASLASLSLLAAGCSLWIEPGDNRSDGGSPSDGGAATDADLDGAVDAFVPSSCPTGFTTTDRGCFRLTGAVSDLLAAESLCEGTRHLEIVAHLAVIESVAEAQAAATVMAGEDDAFVGLVRPVSQTNWVWITGAVNSGAVPWYTGIHGDHDPMGRCAALDVSIALVQTSCSSNNEALCEWDGQAPSVSPP